jgi:hypothetical protein
MISIHHDFIHIYLSNKYCIIEALLNCIFMYSIDMPYLCELGVYFLNKLNLLSIGYFNSYALLRYIIE